MNFLGSILVFHTTCYLILLTDDARDCTWGLLHAMQIFPHLSPSLNILNRWSKLPASWRIREGEMEKTKFWRYTSKPLCSENKYAHFIWSDAPISFQGWTQGKRFCLSTADTSSAHIVMVDWGLWLCTFKATFFLKKINMSIWKTGMKCDILNWIKAYAPLIFF